LRSRPMRSTSLSEHRFTRSMQKPKSGSRHLYPGHRLGRKQASPRLIPSPLRCSVLMSSVDLSTRHQWFTCIRLPDSHLTSSRLAFSATLTTPALYRRSLRWFEASPCRAAPEDLPPSPAQQRCRILHLLHESSFSVRVRTGAPIYGFARRCWRTWRRCWMGEVSRRLSADLHSQGHWVLAAAARVFVYMLPSGLVVWIFHMPLPVLPGETSMRK
jgi:hypothetical protein